MATPYVAGLMGLILSIDPYLSPLEVFNIIRYTATDIGTPGRDNASGYGIVDFARAVDTLFGDAPSISIEYPISGDISTNTDQEIIFRFLSDSPLSSSSISLIVNGRTYTLTSSEMSLDPAGYIEFFPLSDFGEGAVNVRVGGFANVSGISAPILPEFTFYIDNTPPRVRGTYPPVGTVVNILPDYFVFIVDDATGVDFSRFSVSSGSTDRGASSGIHVWGNEVKVPSGLFAMPDTGFFTLRLTAQDRVTIGDPNILDTTITWELALSSVKESITPVSLGMASVTPNPFNSSASFDFTMPDAADVLLSVYDLYGRSVMSESIKQVPAKTNFS
jgi:hypothetical protein